MYFVKLQYTPLTFYLKIYVFLECAFNFLMIIRVKSIYIFGSSNEIFFFKLIKFFFFFYLYMSLYTWYMLDHSSEGVS